MGGNAYLIYGSLEQRHLEKRPIKKTLIDMLLGRQRYLQPKEFTMGTTTMYEVPAGDLNPLKNEFLSFLRKAMPAPWKATTVTFEYLDMDIMTLYMRGDRAAGAQEINWYLQLTFSGCAGMAQVTSDVAAHWAEIWYQVEKSKIHERLTMFGFHPKEHPRDEGPAPLFVPITEGGYAEYSSEPQEMSFHEGAYSFHFSFDSAIEEAEPDQGLALLQRLESDYAPHMADGKCKCQLCAPDLKL